MEYSLACTDIILTLKISNYNGNQNNIKRSKKQFVFKTERTEKALIGFTSKLSFEDKHTDTKQTDLFRTKAWHIHTFNADSKADTDKDTNFKDKHGFKEFSIKNFDNKNECTRQNKQYKSNKKGTANIIGKQQKTRFIRIFFQRCWKKREIDRQFQINGKR